ncbi:YopX family protein [Staphylococcus saprophyticus]|nr:YopX family protein [Staphylococcus saprophyticus]
MIPKFRAWDKVEKEWLEIKLLGFWEDNELWYLEIESGELLFEDDLGVKWELLQSTGLKDKNSVEIFEGDIVKTKCGEYGRHIGVVTFKSGKFSAIGVKQYDGYVEELDGAFEIIGNKYEHPHLLEE